MSERFPVAVSAQHLPVAGDRPVVFHGVNKSGSLAMSNVIRDAYHAEGRGERFFSTYHAEPRDFEQFARLLQRNTGHGFFVSHYIYPGVEPPSDALLVTQLRHPLPRLLSVHGWSKRNYIKRHGTSDDFPDLETWVRRRWIRNKSLIHMQVTQFAVGFPAGYNSTDPAKRAAARVRRKEKLAQLSPEMACEMALENLDRDFAWYGIAELFEESIFALAHICGLGSVRPWQKDTRNRWRESLAETEPYVIELIYERVLPDELRFYDAALAMFRDRLADVDFGASFIPYRERCEGEYGERLVTELTP
jgi:hypothetical protein